MIPHLRTLACVAAVLAAGTLSAQPTAKACRHGAADDSGIAVGTTLLVHPTRLAATVDSVLQAQGYTVTDSPPGLGRWSVAPRYTWLEAVQGEGWLSDEHPGVQVQVETEARGDSTGLSVSARALCRVEPARDTPADVGQMVELLSATMLTAAVTEAMDSLEAAGVDLTAPVRRGGVSVQVPDTVASFVFQRRHDYEDRRLGTNVRYIRQDGLYADVYVYPGVRVDESCDAACAVNAEADGFIASFPEFVRAGHYRTIELAGDERLQPDADDVWAAGRHLTLKPNKDGQIQDSHYFIWSFPGFMVKVRASYAAGDGEALRQVQDFVAELLVKLVSQG